MSVLKPIFERKIAATFGLKTFEILKSYGFKIKIYFFFT